MRLTRSAAFFAGCCGLASATPAAPKKLDYDDYRNDCSLAGVPVPDKCKFQLPREHNWLEERPPIYLGDGSAPAAVSSVSIDFVGPYLHVKFPSFPGYSTKSASITWQTIGNKHSHGSYGEPDRAAFQVADCEPSGAEGAFTCKLHFSDIMDVPSTKITDLLEGICPHGAGEGLDFYVAFSGEAEPTYGEPGTVVPFCDQYPCAKRKHRSRCKPSGPYIKMRYHCSACNAKPCASSSSTTASSTTASSTTSASSTATSSSSQTSSSSSSSSTSSSSTTSSTTSSTSTTPPTPSRTCGFGTAFGFQRPVNEVQKSFTLDTQSGNGCNRWGWYETPTLAELQGGISGPLYVGAGGNDISKAVNVGSWTATATATGGVIVTYSVNPPYTLDEAHIDLDCLPIDTCAPGQYTYGSPHLPSVPVFANPTPLQYPACSGGSLAYLVVHAAVNIVTTGTTCAPPVAS